MSPRNTTILGIDPGGTTGWALLSITSEGRRHLTRWRHGQSTGSLTDLLLDNVGRMIRRDDLVAVEDFVIGSRAVRASTEAALVRYVIDTAADQCRQAGARFVLRPAGRVKPWATDDRLKACDGYCVGMRHSTDAARHALYAAVKAGLLPDPLST